MTAKGQIVFHLPRHLLGDQQMPKIYQELRRGFQARGAEVVLRRREARALQDLPQLQADSLQVFLHEKQNQAV